MRDHPDLDRMRTTEEFAAALREVLAGRTVRQIAQATETLAANARTHRTRRGDNAGMPMPVPVSSSAIGCYLKGDRLPPEPALRTLLAIPGVAAGVRVEDWVTALQTLRVPPGPGVPGAVRVRDANPRLLGVHPAIEVAGATSVLPGYVERDIDAADGGLRSRLRTASTAGGFVLLVGESSVGKTRSAYEALQAVLPGWWLVDPTDPAVLPDLVAGGNAGHVVVWLDELQRHIARGLTSAVIKALLQKKDPVVVVGTLWPDRYLRWSELPCDGDDDQAEARAIVGLAEVVPVERTLSSPERARATCLAEAGDPRIREALAVTDYGLTQTLAGGPQLMARWRMAADPYAKALLTAAIDATRLTVFESVATEAVLTEDLLRAAATGYLDDRSRAEAPAAWFERAVEYAVTRLRGASSALHPVAADVGRTAGYVVADYLAQEGDRERRAVSVPDATWHALRHHMTDPEVLDHLGLNATRRLRFQDAEHFYATAFAKGQRVSGHRLADLERRRRDTDGLRHGVTALNQWPYGTRTARWRRMAFGSRDYLPELRHLADQGIESARFELARWYAYRGDVEILESRAPDGCVESARRLADLLADRRDLRGLRAIVERDTQLAASFAADRLAQHLINRGEVSSAEEFLRQLPEHSESSRERYRLEQLAAGRSAVVAEPEPEDRAAARIAVGRLVHQGRVDESRRLMSAWAGEDPAINAFFVTWLADRDEFDELRERANSQNRAAARRLVDVLAHRGNFPGLWAEVVAGTREACWALITLFEARRLPEARYLRRRGVTGATIPDRCVPG
ncbi:hypothetical protein [Actinoplanes regularis]|uniref:hypothetical protein n=1 Tax=Actinoplanes regularis TaxID=52697 RepID=UPI0024A44227|nr:hypothetical protein [Actinoplanes regularis]GLW35651.1 hypothetical protein Areg01_85860 [Actinoplanes regularis]